MTDNRTNEAIAEEAIKMSWRNYNSDESGIMPTEAEGAKAAVTALEAAGRLAGEPTPEQIEAAAQAVREVDARAGLIADVDLPMYRARAALAAAAGVAPQADSEIYYCPIHGDLLAARRSFVCEHAENGHEYSRHTIPLYGMLDLWMALYGTSHPQFDEFYEKHGYAETWARLLAEVRSRAAEGAAPQAECDCGAGPGSAVCKRVCATRAPVQPSSTVDEAALAEVIATAKRRSLVACVRAVESEKSIGQITRTAKGARRDKQADV